jgi:hypothetical protein
MIWKTIYIEKSEYSIKTVVINFSTNKEFIIEYYLLVNSNTELYWVLVQIDNPKDYDTFPLQHGMLTEDINITNKTITQSIIGCCKVNNNVYLLTNNGNWKTSSQQREIGKKKTK